MDFLFRYRFVLSEIQNLTLGHSKKWNIGLWGKKVKIKQLLHFSIFSFLCLFKWHRRNEHNGGMKKNIILFELKE